MAIVSDGIDQALVAVVLGILTASGGWLTAWFSRRKSEGDYDLARAQATSTYAAIDQGRIEALERDLERLRTDNDYMRTRLTDLENRVRMYREGCDRLHHQLVDAGMIPNWHPPAPLNLHLSSDRDTPTD
jgi:hypothetical protein